MTVMKGEKLTAPHPATDALLREALDACSICHSTEVVKLAAEWNDGRVLPVVACGNPWHYVFPATPPASAFHRADPDGVDDLFGTGETGDPRNGTPPASAERDESQVLVDRCVELGNDALRAAEARDEH